MRGALGPSGPAVCGPDGAGGASRRHGAGGIPGTGGATMRGRHPIPALTRTTPMVFNDPDRVAALTPNSPYDRLPDGRPHVPDELLDRMRLVSPEEAWHVLERRHGFRFQFEGNWLNLHPDRVVVGRAVTAVFMPHRPDLDQSVTAWGEAKGWGPRQNTWIIDNLRPRDLVVVDLFGKIRNGTFAGDNLSTAISTRTGTGMVIDGAIRDRKSTRLNSSHANISYAVFCLKKKKLKHKYIYISSHDIYYAFMDICIA